MKEKSANTNTLSVGGEGKSAKDSHHSLLSTMADPDISLLSLAKFVLSQNGTNHQHNVNNFTYMIHEENVIKKMATYLCTRKISAKFLAIATLNQETSMTVKFHHAHVHTFNNLRGMAKQEERMIQAAASVGRVSTVKLLSKIKTKVSSYLHRQNLSATLRLCG